jgi:hypothetical protein
LRLRSQRRAFILRAVFRAVHVYPTLRDLFRPLPPVIASFYDHVCAEQRLAAAAPKEAALPAAAAPKALSAAASTPSD